MVSSADPPQSTKTKTRRPRRDRRRERNRQLLVDATIELVLEHGSGALSMAAIASRAGVHHPGFYAHFRNVDECLEAAVTQVAAAHHQQTAKVRAALAGRNRPSFEAEVVVTERSLQTLLEYRPMYLLILQCRHEQSRIGELAREEFERFAQELTENVWRMALQVGARAEDLRQLEKLARYILEGIAASALQLLQGHTKDVHEIAERLTRYHWALVSAEFKRIGRSQRESAPPRKRAAAKTRSTT